MRNGGHAASSRARSRRPMPGSSGIAKSGKSGSTASRTMSGSCRPKKKRRRNVGAESDIALAARSIVTTRIIDAPRTLVFEAWTDPKHLAQWWGPNGFSTTTSSFDMRPGGVWRFVMHGPDGRDYQNHVTFEEVVKPE